MVWGCFGIASSLLQKTKKKTSPVARQRSASLAWGAEAKLSGSQGGPLSQVAEQVPKQSKGGSEGLPVPRIVERSGPE